MILQIVSYPSISESMMKQPSGKLMRNAIRRRSGHGSSKRRAEPRNERIFLAGENPHADDSACLIALKIITETKILPLP